MKQIGLPVKPCNVLKFKTVLKVRLFKKKLVKCSKDAFITSAVSKVNSFIPFKKVCDFVINSCLNEENRAGDQHKVQVGLCVQQRFKPICAFGQFDQS